MRTFLPNLKNRLLLFVSVFCFSIIQTLAQTAADYSFTASSGTFTSISGSGTSVAGLTDDDATVSGIPIGFTFNYCGVGYTTVSASSNGWLSFVTTATTGLANDLDGSSYAAIRPLVAPLWDDLAGTTGVAYYSTTGSAGSRVFTMEWNNWEWYYSATAPVISFQVKLYEADNHIEFIYRQEAAVVSSPSASIGIADGNVGAGSFISLQDVSASPAISSVTENFSLDAKPATGQIYRFNAPSNMTYLSSTTTQTNTAVVYQGQTNQQVIGVQVVTSGATSPLTIDQLTFNTTGTSNPTADIQNARLWSTGSSATFATTTQVGAVVAAPNGSFTVSPGTNLVSGTNYFWLTYDVRAAANIGNVIDAQCTAIRVSSTDYTPTVTNPAGTRTIQGAASFDGTFESGSSFLANGMEEVNGSQTNKWYVGTLINNGGARAAYVSNDAGVTHNYNGTSTSVSHFYIDYAFPASDPIINLSFDWLCQGESSFDYLRVYIVPTTTTPVEGVLLASGQLTGILNLQGASWQTENYTLDPAYAGTTQRIVFSWRNDGSVTYAPPAAVDNIIITTTSNDDCVSSAVVPIGAGSCSYNTYNNSYATASGDANGACGDNAVKDVWFRVTVPASGNLVFQANNIDFNDGAMAIYSGNCGSLTEIDCDDDSGPGLMPRIEASGLTAGSTVFIRFWEVSGTQSGDFQLCVFEPEQILVVDASSYTVTELVEDVLITGCLEASNITYSGHASGIGYFDATGAPSVGFADGIVLSSGDAIGAEGPNSSDSYAGMYAGAGDADLNILSGGITEDAAVLEFDFIPSSDNVTFNFIFASDEYNEYVGGSFNDVFGFFISGPGISGPYTNSAENIALIPGTSTPVAINNVNNTLNSAYYVDNDYVDISPLNNEFEFDGYTVPLTAEVTLTACQTYHIKLAVADVGDDYIDSWVLLEANSFTSGNGVLLDVVNATGTTDSYEGCQSDIVFSRVDPSQTSEAINFSYSITGASTATYGVDYTVSNYPNVTIPIGSPSVSVNLNTIQDWVPEGTETIVISLTGGCPCNPTVQTDIIYLHDFETVSGSITTSPPTICQGESTTLQSTVTSGNYVGYSWHNGVSVVGTTQNITVSPLTTTTYTLTLEDSCGFSTTDNIVVTVNTPSTAPTSASASPATICNGGSSTLTVNGGALGTGATWQWYTGSCGGTSVGSGSSISVSPTSTTTYYVRGEGACGNTVCVQTTVTVNPLPTAYNVGSSDSYCSGGAGSPVGLSNSTSGVNYTLYESGISTGTTVAGTGSSISFGNQLVGTYTVIATNTTTSCTNTMSGSAIITIDPLPVQYAVGGTGSYCWGGTGVAVTLSNSQTNTTYELYQSGTATGTTVAGTGSSLSFGNQLAGTYTVVATNNTTGCTNTMSGNAVITVNSLPVAYTVSGTGDYCDGEAGVEVSLSNSALNVSYALYQGGTATGTVVSGTGSSISFGNQQAGSYTVVATNTITGCTNTMTGTATVTENPLPTAFNVTGTGSYCAGASGLVVGLNGSASGVSYELYQGGTATGTVVAGTGSSISFGTQLAGTYTVVATVNSSSCTNNMNGTAVITENPLPTASASASPTSIPNGGTSDLSALPSGSYSYSWSPAGSVVSPTAQNTETDPLTSTTTFTVTVTNSSTGCSNSANVTVTVTGGVLSVTTTPSPSGTICNGESIVITANPSGGSGSYTYAWSAGPTPTQQSQTVSPTTTTTYNVTVTDAVTFGTITSSVLVNVNPLPTLYSVNGTGSYCSGEAGLEVSLSGSQAGILYELYKNGSATGTLMGGTGAGLSFGTQTNGIYTVLATNTVTGCDVFMTGNANITIDALPTQYAVTGTNSYCAGGTGVAVGLANSQSGVNYELYLGGTATGTVVSGTGSSISFGLQTAGTYTVVATNATTGCSRTMTGNAVVTIDPLPSLYNVTGTAAYCAGGTGVVVGLSGSETGVDYELFESGTSTGIVLGGTGSALNYGSQLAGTYTVIATNTSTSCTQNMSGSAVITINALPVVSFSGLEAEYCNAGAIDLLTGNFAPSGSFTISSGGTLIDNANGTASFTPTTGNYNITYTYTDGNGCTNSQMQSTTVNPLPVVSFSGLNSPYCQGDALETITGSPGGSGTFAGTGITDGGTGTATFNPATPGTYDITYTYTDGNSCTNSYSQPVTVNALPTVSFSGLDAEYCHNDAVVTLSGNNAPLGTFNISPAATFVDNGNGTASFTPTTGSYDITYTYTSGNGCVNSITESTVVHSLPVVGMSGLNAAYCNGDPAFVVTGTPTDANGVFSSASANMTDNGNGTANYNPISSGNFSITYTYTDGNGCEAAVTQYSTVNNLPVVDILSLETDYCFGSPLDTIYGNYSSGTFTGDGITNLGSGIASFNSSTLGVNSITYEYTNANNCTNSITLTTTVNPNPVIDGLVTTDVWDCTSPNGTITVNASGGTPAYEYTINGGLSYQASNVFADLNALNYTISVFDVNGCSDTSSVTVGNAVGPDIDSVWITNLNCFGDASGELVIFSSTGVNYSIDNGSTLLPDSLFTGLSAGTYSILVEDIGKCQVSDVVTITQPLELITNVDTSTNVSCNGFADGTAEVSATGGVGSYTYLWDDASATATNTIENLTAGLYYHVTITDQNGCFKVDSVTVTQPTSMVTGFPSSTDISCFGLNDGSATVAAAGATSPFTYLWSNDSTTTTITGLIADVYYFVTVTDANGCEKVDSIILTQPTELSAVMNSVNATCGEENGSSSAVVSGGTPGYSYLWSNGDESDQADSLAFGTHSVTITDANSCVLVETVNIANEGAGTASISQIGFIACYGQNTGSLYVEMTGGTAPFDYQWSSTAENNDTISVLTSGNYFVTVTDVNNCMALDSFEITQPDLLTDIVTITDVFCYGDNDGSIALEVTGGTLPYSYLWSDGQTTATATGLTGGGYTVTVTDYNGCTIIHNNLSVTQPSVEFIANVSVVNEIECNGENGSITAAVSGGSPLYTYAWDANTGSQTTATAINIPSGAYYITVTDANGCTTVGTGTLYQPEALMLVTDTVINVSCKDAADGSISISTYQGTGTYTYLWSNSSVTEDLSNLASGTYELTVTDENNCSLTESFVVLNSEIPCYELEIPSAFTPNNDGTNDTWEIGGVEAVANIEIEIFNRWGQSIFSFTGTGAEYADLENQWDGTYNGAEVPLGSYVYILKLGETEEETYNGTITIIR